MALPVSDRADQRRSGGALEVRRARASLVGSRERVPAAARDQPAAPRLDRRGRAAASPASACVDVGCGGGILDRSDGAARRERHRHRPRPTRRSASRSCTGSRSGVSGRLPARRGGRRWRAAARRVRRRHLHGAARARAGARVDGARLRDARAARRARRVLDASTAIQVATCSRSSAPSTCCGCCRAARTTAARFIKPSELARDARRAGLELARRSIGTDATTRSRAATGSSADTSVNYLAAFRKQRMTRRLDVEPPMRRAVRSRRHARRHRPATSPAPSTACARIAACRRMPVDATCARTRRPARAACSAQAWASRPTTQAMPTLRDAFLAHYAAGLCAKPRACSTASTALLAALERARDRAGASSPTRRRASPRPVIVALGLDIAHRRDRERRHDAACPSRIPAPLLHAASACALPPARMRLCRRRPARRRRRATRAGMATIVASYGYVGANGDRRRMAGDRLDRRDLPTCSRWLLARIVSGPDPRLVSSHVAQPRSRAAPSREPVTRTAGSAASGRSTAPAMSSGCRERDPVGLRDADRPCARPEHRARTAVVAHDQRGRSTARPARASSRLRDRARRSAPALSATRRHLKPRRRRVDAARAGAAPARSTFGERSQPRVGAAGGGDASLPQSMRSLAPMRRRIRTPCSGRALQPGVAPAHAATIAQRDFARPLANSA